MMEVQSTIPFTLVNNSTYADENVFVGIVGMQTGQHVWVDPKDGTSHQIQRSDNTVQGPIYNNDRGPGGQGKYANCFTRLSEIPRKVIDMPEIDGCRILFSFNNPLYLYFFGPTQGYAGVNLSNPNDPNHGICFEMIELTHKTNGLWANTSRVDSFKYPMGLEVWGNNFYKKVGELKTHDQILSQWHSTAPDAFRVCFDEKNKIIHFPSKVPAFQRGGQHENYFRDYIDAIWTRYASENLIFNAGDAGTWSGGVEGSTFTFKRTSDGQVASIRRKPTTMEAMEGSGVLADGGQWDRVIQAQICAAINRHAINLNLPAGATQDFATAAKYYMASPFNWYSMFLHQPEITFGGLAYGFCYDDVFNQSSTIDAPSPTHATITIGGFAPGK